MIILPCLPVFLAGSYVTHVFLIALVAVWILLLCGRSK